MIPRQPFGDTGHESTRIIFGAAALYDVTQDAADRVLEQLLRAGINHIDTAASYGEAELRIARALPMQERGAVLFGEVRNSLEQL